MLQKFASSCQETNECANLELLQLFCSHALAKEWDFGLESRSCHFDQRSEEKSSLFVVFLPVGESV